MSKSDNSMQTNLVGRTCQPNLQHIHLWPWATNAVKNRSFLIAQGKEDVQAGDLEARTAEIVAVAVVTERDGSCWLQVILLALDGEAKGELVEAHLNWFKII